MAEGSADRKEQRRRGQEVLDELAASLTSLADVDRKVMFGSNGLRTGGKFFAFVGVGGELMIKVPATRADGLVEAGSAQRVKIGRNPAREWIGVPLDVDHELWRTLLAESHRFVSERAG